MGLKKKNLILGAARGYTFDDVQLFVNSLKRTGFSGDTRLFFTTLSPRDCSRLRKAGVQPCFFNDRPPFLQDAGRRSKSYLASHAHDLSYFRLKIPGTGIHCQRFLLDYLYLLRHGSKYSHVLLTDVVDVVFQKDPFDDRYKNGVLYSFQEKKQTIGSSYWTRGWVHVAYGAEALAKISDRHIVCSGVVLGSVRCIMDYLEKMIRAFENVKKMVHGVDQAAHNYLIYTDEFPKVKLLTNESGPVMHCALASPDEIKLTRDHLVKNRTGRVVSLVHQYNRHPALMKLFREKYGAPCPAPLRK